MGSDIIEWLMEHVFPWLLLIFIVVIAAIVPLAIYSSYKQSKSPTFTLHKNEWAYTNMQRVPVTTYVQSGKVLVPITSYSNECHQWSRQP